MSLELKRENLNEQNNPKNCMDFHKPFSSYERTRCSEPVSPRDLERSHVGRWAWIKLWRACHMRSGWYFFFLNTHAVWQNATFNLSTWRQRQAHLCARQGHPGIHSEFQDSQSYIVRPCLRKKQKATYSLQQYFYDGILESINTSYSLLLIRLLTTNRDQTVRLKINILSHWQSVKLQMLPIM